ncbi:MAG: ABC transporter substrate-binding protein [Eubacteriales bacterium]|nr:ABC transporter substrate-binding protein [Eubacteriales bacterium]
MKKFLSVALALALILTSLTACTEEGSNNDVLKVGAIYPMSGTNALLGSQCMEAVRIAVDMVNENGGVQGRSVELSEADAPEPTAAATEANRLVDKEGVKIVFGSLASGNALSIAQVTDKRGVCLVESGGIADSLTDSGFKYVFRILDKGGLRGSVGVDYIAESISPALGKDAKDIEIAIVHEDSSYGESVANGAEKQIKKLGMNLVSREHYNVSVTDMSAIVLNIKKAQPDVLLTVNYIDDAVRLVDTLKQHNAMPKVFMGCGAGTTDPKFAMTIGSDSDGFFCTDMPTNLPMDVFAGDEKLYNAVSDFREAFLAQHKELNAVPIAAEAAFTGAYTFMNDILPKAGDLDDPDSIRSAALEEKLELTALGFGWDLGEDGQNYAAFANINQWQNGKVVTVAPEKLKNGQAINVPLPISSY